MTDAQALELAIQKTGVERFRDLLNPEHPAWNPAYWETVHRIAAEPEHQRSEGPSLAQRAVNFGTAVVQHAAGGFKITSPEVAAKRLAICQACDQFSGYSCKLCGCNMPVKVTWAEQTCPLAKWPSVN